MSGTSRVGFIAILLLASGCVYASQAVRPEPRLWAGGRPATGYYCYDCHGYRFFDPYYDWCPYYGFAYRWDRSPELIRTYRERYVALKARDRRLGHWRYPNGYRISRRYREPRDYAGWLERRSIRDPDARLKTPGTEQSAPDRGKTQRDPRDPGATHRRGESRDHRPRRNGT
jgi:hypothetical protein